MNITNKRTIFSFSFIILGAAGFSLGMLASNVKGMWYYLFIPLAFGVIVGIWEWAFWYILSKVEQKATKDNDYILSTTLTQKTDEGYTLNPADLYDAIEKLGYIEHDMEGHYEADHRSTSNNDAK